MMATGRPLRAQSPGGGMAAAARGFLATLEPAQRTKAQLAFDAASERIEKRLRRYKRKLKDHHAPAPASADPSRQPG